MSEPDTDIEQVKNAAIENIRKSALPNSANNSVQVNSLKPFMTKNKNRLYNDSDSDKDLILYHLKKRAEQVSVCPETVISTGKNLLYYSLFYSTDYVNLLEVSLASIVKNTPTINFDLLIITDAETKTFIEKLPSIKNFNVDYLVINSVESAPLASINKLEIFNYPRINEYEKVLFLDADTVCIKDLTILFSKQLILGKLYISFTPNHLSPRLLSPTHGMMYLTKEDAEFLYENTTATPFNAGQFMFVNSARMKKHFENVKWLQLAWTGEYFYEQGFMNYYFVFNQLTKPLVDTNGDQLIVVTYNPAKPDTADFIQSAVADEIIKKNSVGRKSLLVVTGATKSNFSKDETFKRMVERGMIEDTTKLHNDSTVVIHFAATLPSGKTKKEFINSYANANQLHI